MYSHLYPTLLHVHLKFHFGKKKKKKSKQQQLLCCTLLKKHQHRTNKYKYCSSNSSVSYSKELWVATISWFSCLLDLYCLLYSVVYSGRKVKQTWKSMHYYINTNTHKQLNGSQAKKSETFKVKCPVRGCGLLEI